MGTNSSADLRENSVKTDMSVWAESFRKRISFANSASARARYTLIIVVLLSAGLSLAMFAYFNSWNKKFALEYQDQNELSKETEGEIPENIVRDGVIREWLSTGTYQVPIIGFKVMASDLPLFAPLALIIASTWLYYSIRREHYTIGRLIGDVYVVFKDKIKSRDDLSIVTCQEIYHGIISNTLLNVIPYDSPIKSLEEAMKSAHEIKSESLGFKVRKGIVFVLIYLPVFSILFIAFIRVLTFISIKSTITNSTHIISDLIPLRQNLLVIASVLSLIGIIQCSINASIIIKFLKSTRKLLDEYQLWAFKGIQPNSNDEVQC